MRHLLWIIPFLLLSCATPNGKQKADMETSKVKTEKRAKTDGVENRKRKTKEVKTKITPSEQRKRITSKVEGKQSKPKRKEKASIATLEHKTVEPQKVEKETSKPKEERVKPSATKEIKSSQIPPKVIETAKLSVLKGSAQIQKEGNIVYEALPKKLKNGCYSVLVKVKNLKEKVERDYTLEVCNGKVKLQ